MPAPRKYPQELRERAVRMVFEIRRQTGGAPGAIARVADQLGVHREALRGWVRQAEIDEGQRPGTSATDAQRIVQGDLQLVDGAHAEPILRDDDGRHGSGAPIRDGSGTTVRVDQVRRKGTVPLPSASVVCKNYPLRGRGVPTHLPWPNGRDAGFLDRLDGRCEPCGPVATLAP
ncbi:hypothetical protein GCM10010517_16280 [Streptosporangium fragile]|uniref:Transposase n=1 Tax=Streptosporangium fragile TaxID=46186 RepID=A0ABN3VV06_9ACTN